jgi:hypothetical protein
MIISSRQPLQKLRRSPAGLSPGMLGVKHLLETPPPSPSLPSLMPRHGKKLKPAYKKRGIRLLVWFTGVTVILFFALSRLNQDKPPAALPHLTEDGQTYEIVGDDRLPTYPAPVAVADKRGRPMWTVSIPPEYSFPLKPSQYADICHQSHDVAQHVSSLKKGGSHGGHGHFSYYHVDPYFMDVADAEEHGLLPGSGETLGSKATAMWNGFAGAIIGDDKKENVAPGTEVHKVDKVCEKSLTYVLETADAGLGKTLLGLWMAYGLAKKEGRAFFVDDSNWYDAVPLLISIVTF